MAKRKRKKAKRPSSDSKARSSAVKAKKAIPAGLSREQYNRLRDRAVNARRRLRNYSKADKYSAYIIPSTDDYKLSALLNRIENGESNRKILNELNRLKPANFEQQFVTQSGYMMSPDDYNQLKREIKEANKNIRSVLKAYGDIVSDVLPQQFNEKEVLSKITSKQGVLNELNDLTLFTIENLQPRPINDDGEAGTTAEYLYRMRILQRENLRRKENRDLYDTLAREGHGYLIPDETDFTRGINLAAISGMDELRRKSAKWTDSARLVRANLFISNYIQSTTKVVSGLIDNGMYTNEVKAKLDKIVDLASRFYNNEEAITRISTQVPEIVINSIYSLIDSVQNIDLFLETWEREASYL